MKKPIITTIFIGLFAVCAFAQSTEFTYQGRLLDNSLPPTANYDFEFSLWDALVAGNQQGTTQTVTGVAVANGIFTVKLNFGAQFTGAARFMQIAVRPSSGGAYTTLAPRQPITSTPQSMNSARLAGRAADEYVLTNDPRMTDPRDPLPNSSNYIRNSDSLQSGSNFNISGSGVIGESLTVQNSVSVGNSLQVAGTSQFTGPLVSSNNITTTGTLSAGNSSVGSLNASSITTPGNLSVGGNQFISGNLGIGVSPSHRLTVLGDGYFTGALTVEQSALVSSSLIVGATATVGSNFSVGGSASISGNLTAGNSTIGTINSSSISSTGNVSASGNGTFGGNFRVVGNTGLGTTSPATRLHLVDNGGQILFGGGGCVSGHLGLGFASTLTCSNYSILGNGTDTFINRPAGGAILFRENNGTQVVINSGGTVSLFALGSSGGTPLCFNPFNQISACSSSIRYKDNIRALDSGLDLIRHLRPVSFNWKADNKADIGLVAEEVAEALPELVTRNKRGEIEGVKYDRIGVIAVNAIKELQAQIERQQRQIEALKKLVCAQSPIAEECKVEEVNP